MIDKAAVDGDLADGDVYIFNDPYDGGTHLSDFKLVRPFFRDNNVFCYLAWVWSLARRRRQCTRQLQPGATESFQEGMLIPPGQTFSKGELHQDIIDILKAIHACLEPLW
ncbi:MAG: hypothetical protein CM1200mP18_19340 [Gammaproteobacteria bacterium]|nr:MAG: hypothetical protein CM1200mP18_19340 [Gammaproteobacteria bacterium]